MEENREKAKYMSKPNLRAVKKFSTEADKLREQSMYKDAVAIYLNAILIDRNDVNSYYGLGLCYKSLGNYAKAIKTLEKATELKPDFYEAFYELGICHLLEGIPCGAIKNFVCAIRINPENPSAILQLGVAHELCEEEDMALMIYQKLIENTPNYIKAYEHKSRLLMKLKRYKEACAVLINLIKIVPTYADAYLGIATCLEKTGNKSDAQRYYRKFINQRPQLNQAQFAKNRLKDLKQKSKNIGYLSLV
ncbi:tetratricopeptide repeat protein [bacterium]|nr:tetratricopeptide repeat protein [bacterium]